MKSAADRTRRLSTGLALALAGPPVLATLFVAATRPDDASRLYAGLLVAGLAGLLWLAASRAPRAPQWVLAGASLALCLWPETCLRVSGFRFDRAGVIEFGYPRPDKMSEARRDSELFWTLDPAIEGVNSAGFPGPEFEIPKPAGRRRVVFFGDSVLRYPPLVEEALNSLPDAQGRFEAHY